MTYFERELIRIRKNRYANHDQIQLIIAVHQHIRQYAHLTLDLKQLSRKFYLSRYHLQRLFKRYYGQSPKQFQTECRIKGAKAMLTAGKTVRETCFDVGFSSLGSFSSLFKRWTGRSPSAYRKSQLSRKEHQNY